MKFVFVKNHLKGLEPYFYTSLGNTLLSNLQFPSFKQLRKSFLKTPEANHITPELSSFTQTLQGYQPAQDTSEGTRLSTPPTTLIYTQHPRACGNNRERGVYISLTPPPSEDDPQCSPFLAHPNPGPIRAPAGPGAKRTLSHQSPLLPKGPPSPSSKRFPPAKGARGDQRRSWRERLQAKVQRDITLQPREGV